ncbi:phage protease [Cupriavidus taiwanensis]|uniref:phage protease n=1 Tax=Cupriavidus taiwanensis TaxID=164546 RepID=UPI00254106AC|nr:phage protease [Cupriavidus taiwanensis]MDK3025572.1 phage protease [Cupriavidus taiwanensis]
MTIRYSIARLSVEISTGSTSTIQLMPAGAFRGMDGRPKECDAWHIDAATAARVIDQVNGRKTRYVIDYEHQTLAAAKNGQPAPAAGWFSQVEWREGAGLFAVGVEWTERASAFIDAKEYRYISPVFSYDPKTGEVGQLLHAALTNNPAVDGMDEVALAAASRLLVDETTSQGVPPVASLKETSMDIEALLEQLRWLLNMPVGATADEIKAQLQKLIDQLSAGQGTAAASVNLVELLAERDQQIAALTANQVDLAQYVPISVVDGLRADIAALNEQIAANNSEAEVATVDSLVTAALSDGRLHPTMETWARELGKSNLDSLKSYVDKAKPIAALRSTQTSATKLPAAGVASQDAPLDEAALAVCTALGVDPAAYAKANTPQA